MTTRLKRTIIDASAYESSGYDARPLSCHAPKNQKVDTPVSKWRHALAIQPKLPNQPPRIAAAPAMRQARARRCYSALKGSIAVLNRLHYAAATLSIALLPPLATAAPPE